MKLLKVLYIKVLIFPLAKSFVCLVLPFFPRRYFVDFVTNSRPVEMDCTWLMNALRKTGPKCVSMTWDALFCAVKNVVLEVDASVDNAYFWGLLLI